MTESAGRRFAWAVFGLVVLVLGATMLASLAGVRAAGSGGQTLEPAGGEVVVVGAPGLSWSDVSETGTPTLWRLVGEGASGGLIVRGTHEVTCPADGWLTLGAGQRASADDDGVQDCAAIPEVVEGTLGVPGEGSGASNEGQSADPTGDLPATVTDWSDWTAAAERRPLDAVLGTMTSALEADGHCVRAAGPLAALGAAGTTGEVSQYAPTGLSAYAPGVCDVTLLDAGPIVDASDAVDLDTRLAALTEQLPEGTTLVVAGLSDRGEVAGVRAALVWRAGMQGGELHSATTRQSGLVQTTDLTATVLTLADTPVPESVSGLPLQVSPDSRAPSERVGARQDLAAAVEGAGALQVPVLAIGCVLALSALASLVVRRRWTSVRVLGLAAMAFPSAAFLAGLVPWWMFEPAWVSLTATLVALVALQVAVALAGPWRAHPLGPPAVIAALTVLVLGVDVVLGGRLGLISMLGVLPLSAGRFHGMGNVGFGVFAVAGLLLAGFLVSLLRSRPMTRRTAAACVVGVLGLLLVLVDGAPVWGADFGGVPALVVALGVLGLAAAEIRLTLGRALLVGGAALLAAAALMLLDWLRPEGSRTHLGDFAQTVIDGGGLDVVTRKLDQSLGILVRYPISWLAVLVLVVIIWAVASPRSVPGRFLSPLWQLPLLRATAGAVLSALVLGWALNDSGVATVGIGLAVAIAAAIAIAAALAGRRGQLGLADR